MSVLEQKNSIRAEILARRRQLSPQQRTRFSQTICEKIRSQTPIMGANTVAAFMPTKEEVNILPLLEELVSLGKKVALPRIVGKRSLVFHLFTGLNSLKESRYPGFFEPKKDSLVISEQLFDFIIIPAVAVDKDKNRLGYGGGFYDIFLSHARSVFSCVPVFRCQLFDQKLPTEPHDIQISHVFTE